MTAQVSQCLAASVAKQGEVRMSKPAAMKAKSKHAEAEMKTPKKSGAGKIVAKEYKHGGYVKGKKC